MPLYWLVHDIDGRRVIYVQEAGAEVYAQLALLRAGEPISQDTRVEAHELTPAMARKVPAKMRGRALSEREARELLGKLGA